MEKRAQSTVRSTCWVIKSLCCKVMNISQKKNFPLYDDVIYKYFQSKSNVDSIYQQRLDNTRTMLIGGFDPVFADQGGEQNEKTWIFNTTHWKSTAPSLVARDRPACCIVNMPDGKV